jgi:hypothetical protein
LAWIHHEGSRALCRPRLDDIQAKNGNRLGAAALAGAHRNGTHQGVRFGGGAIQRTGIEVQPDFDSDTYTVYTGYELYNPCLYENESVFVCRCPSRDRSRILDSPLKI